MTISNTLFNNLTNKLKLETSLLQKEKSYVRNLLDQASYLKKLKESNSKKLSAKNLLTLKVEKQIYKISL